MSQDVSVPLSSLITLTIECWRMSGVLADTQSESALVKHAVGKMEEILGQMGLEARSLEGISYDAGMNAEVIERVLTDSLPPATSIVSETLSPLVTFQGNVVKGAQVVLAVGAFPRRE